MTKCARPRPQLAGNHNRVTSMATMYFTTRPLMRRSAFCTVALGVRLHSEIGFRNFECVSSSGNNLDPYDKMREAPDAEGREH